MKIKFLDLKKQYLINKNNINKAINDVIKSTNFIGGKQKEIFESNFSTFVDSKYCLGVANGTDAIEIALESLTLKKNSEIIVPSNSWISTSEAVSRNNNKIVFCDIDKDSYLIDPDKISSISNYRSNEIYFQLIFKVIKKVKYDDKEAIIQLFKSDSSELKDIIRDDYFKIISKEMNERELFNYSPFKRLISLELSSKKKDDILSKGDTLYNEIKNKFSFCDITNVGLIKSRGKIIYKIYLKLDRVRNLRKNKKIIFEEIIKVNRMKKFNNNLITIDVDP